MIPSVGALLPRPKTSFVLPGTVGENIDPFQVYTTDSTDETLHRVCLGQFIDAKAQGLDTRFKEDMLSNE